MQVINVVNQTVPPTHRLWPLTLERRIIASTAFPIGTLSIATMHAIRPELQIDTVTLGLMVAAMLPWAATILTSLKAPGGWELQFRQFEDRLSHTENGVEEMRGGVESLTHRADVARDVVLGGVTSSQAVRAPAMDPPAEAGPSADEHLRGLTQRYNLVRDTQVTGDARTATMTGIVSELIRLAPHLAKFSAARALASDDDGTRLSGYAYLFAQPDISLLDTLVTATLEDDTRFGQYWGLQAVSRAVALLDPTDTVTRNRVADQLQALLTRLEREHKGGDRRYELKRILRLLGRQ